LGNDLAAVNNEISDIIRELQQIVAELTRVANAVTALNNPVNVMLVTDVFMGFASAGVGAIKGFFAAGAERGFQIGEKEIAKIVTSGGNDTLRIGEGVEKITIKAEPELFDLEATRIVAGETFTMDGVRVLSRIEETGGVVLNASTGSFVNTLKVECALLVSNFGNYIAGKITIKNAALFAMGLITKFIKFAEYNESQIEMAKMNDESIISLNFKNIKVFGLLAAVAGHMFTGLATSHKSSWIAPNVVTADLLNGLSNGYNDVVGNGLADVKHFIGIIEGE